MLYQCHRLAEYNKSNQPLEVAQSKLIQSHATAVRKGSQGRKNNIAEPYKQHGKKNTLG